MIAVSSPATVACQLGLQVVPVSPSFQHCPVCGYRWHDGSQTVNTGIFSPTSHRHHREQRGLMNSSTKCISEVRKNFISSCGTTYVPCIKMLTVAPLASIVHAGPTEAELIVTFRSVFTGCEKHTNTQHWPTQSLLPCRQHDGQGNSQWWNVWTPLLPLWFGFIRVYWYFAKFRKVRTL